jgi:membrane-associated protein
MFDIPQLVQTAGYLGLSAIVFAESGLFFGFFLPGDSLLFTAGYLSSQGFFSIWLLTPLLTVSAILGDSAGYWFGKKIGPAIFSKPDSRWFSKERINQTHDFFEKYGPKSIVLARFIPAVRTFTPILAGVGNMRYGVFLTYNVLGALLWASGLTLMGYFLGALVPGIDRYIVLIVLLIIFVSVLPIAKELYNEYRSRRAH